MMNSWFAEIFGDEQSVSAQSTTTDLALDDPMFFYQKPTGGADRVIKKVEDSALCNAISGIGDIPPARAEQRWNERMERLIAGKSMRKDHRTQMRKLVTQFRAKLQRVVQATADDAEFLRLEDSLTAFVESAVQFSALRV